MQAFLVPASSITYFSQKMRNELTTQNRAPDDILTSGSTAGLSSALLLTYYHKIFCSDIKGVVTATKLRVKTVKN